jgi:hypothetical protein
MPEGAPILHPDFNTYAGFRQKVPKPSNIFATFWEEATSTPVSFYRRHREHLHDAAAAQGYMSAGV